MSKKQSNRSKSSRNEKHATLIEHTYEETPEDRWQARMNEKEAEEAASWAAGRNLINEGGVLRDLDKASIAELERDLEGHPEYVENNKDGEPRRRLIAVLERKKKELVQASEQGETDKPNASAKEYTLNRLRGFTSLTIAWELGTFGSQHLMEALDRMNRDVAVIKVGNAVKYLVTGVDASGRKDFRFLPQRDFIALYANVLVPGIAVEECNLGKTKADGYPLATVWDKWPKRRELEGIGFFPGSDIHPAIVPTGYLNMWSGLAIQPKEGDWSLFRAHLHDKVCGGNQEHFDFLADWLAQAVQHPQEKPGSAIVLKSAQKGSGKSMLLRFLRKIFGRHLYSAARPDQLTGKFNGHLEETLIFGVEEGFWAGNPAANSTLKDLITAEYIAIERKGLDSRNAPNFTRFIFLSNEDWVIPVGSSERRYFVLDFENDKAKDQDYFNPIFKQMEQEGGIEAMLFDLSEREIKSNLRNPPVTKGLLAQRVQGLSGTDRFLFDLAKEGEVVLPHTDRRITLDPHGTTKVGKSIVWDAAKQYVDRHEARALQTSLGMRLTSLGIPVEENRTGDHRRSFVFPRLPVFQRSVSKLLNVPIDIEDDGRVRDEINKRLYHPGQTAPTAGVLDMQKHRAKSGTSRSTRHH